MACYMMKYYGRPPVIKPKISLSYFCLTLLLVFNLSYHGLGSGEMPMTLITRQGKIEFTYASHCVSKNLKPRRMLKTSFLKAQIIGWNISFQNMYDML